VKGKKTFTPIESQPENVIELVQNYSVLKKDATYRRRVSWLGIGARESIALNEYFGKFPGLSLCLLCSSSVRSHLYVPFSYHCIFCRVPAFDCWGH
jgi:hypothetical protein